MPCGWLVFRAAQVSLIKDLNGNHVVQRCLQRLGPEDSQFIYDAAISNCVEVATHRHVSPGAGWS
jgi:hypothetical protein